MDVINVLTLGIARALKLVIGESLSQTDRKVSLVIGIDQTSHDIISLNGIAKDEPFQPI